MSTDENRPDQNVSTGGSPEEHHKKETVGTEKAENDAGEKPPEKKGGWGAWLFGLVAEVRNDFVKDALKASVKAGGAFAFGALVGGGGVYLASGSDFRDLGTDVGPGYNYLSSIVHEVTRADDTFVRWPEHPEADPVVMYCGSFQTNQEEPLDRLRQFVAQWPECVSLEEEAVGNEVFHDLRVGEGAKPMACLTDASGNIVERIFTCGCGDNTAAEATVAQVFLTESGAIGSGPCE